MAEPDQWRAKYLASLDKLEAEEKSWKALEDVLRRIVGRLCIAARGVDRELDGELGRVGQAMRQSAGTQDLEALLVKLSGAITALDSKQKDKKVEVAEVPPPPPVAAPPARDDRLQLLLNGLLDQLSLLPELQPQLLNLREQIGAAKGDAELADACARIADLANTQRAQLEKDKAHVAAILQQVTGKLDEIANYLSREAADVETSRGSSEELNRRMMSEVRSLDTSVKQATDLSALQQQVRARLDAINVHLLDFRTREEARATAYRERADKMRKRIAELEKETDVLQRSLQQKARQVLTDPLTGVSNRLAYDERMGQTVRRWKRSGGPICVVAWDIDHFKRVNDTYGHQAGDKVLQLIGQHLLRSVRESDFVARYGGEEFAMILEGAPLAEAAALVERMRDAVSKIAFHFRGQPVQVTISCGMTELREGDTAETVFERADQLLYKAKNEGRNRCASG